MKNSKHTPGPWKYDAGNRDVVVSEQGCNDVLIAQLYKIGQNLDANARLIAAAPELFEELQCLIEYLQSMNLGETQECLNAKVVIAKAKGGE